MRQNLQKQKLPTSMKRQHILSHAISKFHIQLSFSQINPVAHWFHMQYVIHFFGKIFSIKSYFSEVYCAIINRPAIKTMCFMITIKNCLHEEMSKGGWYQWCAWQWYRSFKHYHHVTSVTILSIFCFCITHNEDTAMPGNIFFLQLTSHNFVAYVSLNFCWCMLDICQN